MTGAVTTPDSSPLLGDQSQQENSMGPDRSLYLEIGVAVAVFIAFCVVVLLKATIMAEPDDYAYRGAIASLAHGHLELTTAQYKALASQLGGIQQWTKLPNGMWMSEKNPGYPFYGVIFYRLHAMSFAPLVAGALASTSLFIAARTWAGRWAGTYAVTFFLASGMAMAFATRSYMPTFTDASFIAAGAGAILWAMLSQDATFKRRTTIGLLGFLAVEFAVFMRYTNIVMLIAAVLAVLCCWKPARLRRGTVAWWLGSVGFFGSGVAIFDWLVYGKPTKTGYANGEITFSTSAIIPNLNHMPSELIHSVPALLVGLGALIWMVVRLLRSRFSSSMTEARKATARRDGLVGGFLALGWLGLWGLYSAYTWTVGMAGGGIGHGGFPGGRGFGGLGGSATTTSTAGTVSKAFSSVTRAVLAATTNTQRGFPGGGGMGGGGGIHVIRFYVPAIGIIALLAAWFVMQLPKWIAPLLPALAAVFAYGSFHTLTAGGNLGGGFGGGGVPAGVNGQRGPGQRGFGSNGTPPSLPNGGTLPNGSGPQFGNGNTGFGPPPGGNVHPPSGGNIQPPSGGNSSPPIGAG